MDFHPSVCNVTPVMSEGLLYCLENVQRSLKLIKSVSSPEVKEFYRKYSIALLSSVTINRCFSGRDKRIPGRPPQSPQVDRSRGQGPRPAPPQDRSVQLLWFCLLGISQLEVWTFWSHLLFLIGLG